MVFATARDRNIEQLLNIPSASECTQRIQLPYLIQIKNPEVIMCEVWPGCGKLFRRNSIVGNTAGLSECECKFRSMMGKSRACLTQLMMALTMLCKHWASATSPLCICVIHQMAHEGTLQNSVTLCNRPYH